MQYGNWMNIDSSLDNKNINNYQAPMSPSVIRLESPSLGHTNAGKDVEKEL